MMFQNILTESKKTPTTKEPSVSSVSSVSKDFGTVSLAEDNNSENAEELLRKHNIKIKLVTPTAFGTQITLAKHYEKETIGEILKGKNVKYKGKEIFVMN